MTGVRRCGCGYETHSNVSMGMHRAYKHNPNHPYRKRLEKIRLFHEQICEVCGRKNGEHSRKEISECVARGEKE